MECEARWSMDGVTIQVSVRYSNLCKYCTPRSLLQNFSEKRRGKSDGNLLQIVAITGGASG